MSVSFEEVAGRKSNGELNSSWSKQGATMVEKVAKVRALREAFIEEFQGMYVEEEFENTKEKSTVTDPFADVIKAEVVEVQDANEQQLPRTDGE